MTEISLSFGSDMGTCTIDGSFVPLNVLFKDMEKFSRAARLTSNGKVETPSSILDYTD